MLIVTTPAICTLQNISCYSQILMSVQLVMIYAISKPCVWILMEVIPVHVTQDMLEMGKTAMVSILVYATGHCPSLHLLV